MRIQIFGLGSISDPGRNGLLLAAWGRSERKGKFFSSFVFLSPDSVTRRGLIPPKWLIFGSIKILAKKGQKSNFNLDLGIIYAVMSKLC